MSDKSDIVSKRDVIQILYNNFTAELFKVINLEQLFPKNIDIVDLVCNMTFLFPINCNVDNVISDLIIIHNITHTDDQLIQALIIIKKFLNSYNQV